MRAARSYLGGLVRLGKIADPVERLGVWRQSMATLAAQVASQTPVPLEGQSPEALLESTRVALSTGLVDDLGFLAASHGAAALYELAAALPASDEKRELGRRVLSTLHQGDAPTFVALATQLALGSRRALSGARIRARLALSLDLPIGAGARADALALALISRRDLEREWLTMPSTGSLASRRLSARLLERAAREAARRASQGDDGGVRVFAMESVRAAWSRLLADRESLVWRHVATARGLLSDAIPELGAQIQKGLSPSLSPTEWRRAAASLAARIAVQPVSALRATSEVLGGEVQQRDPGVAAALLLGLPRAAEAEPEAADAVLGQTVRRGGIEAFEALLDLRQERIGQDVGARASVVARQRLAEMMAADQGDDDGRVALMEALHAELAPEDERDATTLTERIGEALVAFAEVGPRGAWERARQVLDAAEGTLGTLLLSKDVDSVGRRHAFRALRELDLALLEKSTLGDLLTLGSPKGESDPQLAEIHDRLGAWLIAKERGALRQEGPVPHTTLRMRNLRSILHLVDADALGDDSGGATRARRLETARTLLGRVQRDASSPLRRIVCAAAARACDALVRDDLCEVSDVLVAIGTAARSPQDLLTFAEASMVPEVDASVRAYARLHELVDTAAGGGSSERACLDALLSLANELPVASSPRVEALRASLLALVRALEVIAAAGSLRELAEGSEGTLLAPLETAVETLAELVVGARRRLGDPDAPDTPASGAAIRLLDFCVERALRGSRDALAEALESAVESLRHELPRLLADATLVSLERIAWLPLDAPRRTRTSFLPAAPSEAPLPAWVPPSRTLGGFFVLKPLGAGAAGSVFVARRADQRTDTNAERFALKVPDYDGDAARTLSEGEFLRLFRQEAGALLSLPRHGNLAHFVTFDAGARPKPILVMELVEGPSLERAVEMADLDMRRALSILQGIGAGLEAMHAAEVGHLDVKPSNVILRDPSGTRGSMATRDPVLVDFGLAGRHIRPGCGTGEYGAPEIWGSLGAGAQPSPLPADVYAFGCLAYEVLTGKTLFEAPTAMGLIAAHVAHDGRPPGVRALLEEPGTAALGELLTLALRRAPADRATVAEICAGLDNLRGRLEARPWPLGR